MWRTLVRNGDLYNCCMSRYDRLGGHALQDVRSKAKLDDRSHEDHGEDGSEPSRSSETTSVQCGLSACRNGRRSMDSIAIVVDNGRLAAMVSLGDRGAM